MQHPGRKRLFRRFVVEAGQRDVLEIVLATRAPGRFARGLDRRQQQRDQDSDNGDDDQ